MTATYIPLGLAQLALASLLIMINIGVSLGLNLGLERTLGIAAVRMVGQLLLVGVVLEWLFEQDNPVIILSLSLFMATIAGISAVNRTKQRFERIYWSSLISVWGSSVLVTAFALMTILRPQPWYDPQYVIPLLGMVLGNTLTGISLALDRFMEDLVQQRQDIETRLSLGATRWEAAHAQVQEAVRVGMIPTINSMMIMGLVSLPGMMTGQILAGAKPIEAVRYQIVIIFMIAAAAALGIFGVVLLAYNQLLSPDHQLRLDRLQQIK